MSLFAVAGVTGQTGAATAEALLARGHQIRVIVREPAKAAPWTARGAEVAVADLSDTPALTRALAGVDGAYLLNPPARQAEDPVAVAGAVGRSLATAARDAGVPRTVVLSSVGGHLAQGTGIILTTHAVEQAFAAVGGPVTVLRAPYFLENQLGVLGLVREQGILPTMLLADQAIDMIPVADIGTAAADILTGAIPAAPVVELRSAEPASPRDVAAALADVLGRPVQAVGLPRSDWDGVVAAWGVGPATQALYMAMHEGINDGTVAWQGAASLTGRTRLADWALSVAR